jgi:hypothetical protein
MERNRHRLTLLQKSTPCTTDLKDAIARSANALRPSPSPRKAAGSVTVVQEHRLHLLLRPRRPPAKSHLKRSWYACLAAKSCARTRSPPAAPASTSRSSSSEHFSVASVGTYPAAATSRCPGFLLLQAQATATAWRRAARCGRPSLAWHSSPRPPLPPGPTSAAAPSRSATAAPASSPIASTLTRPSCGELPQGHDGYGSHDSARRPGQPRTAPPANTEAE